MGGHSTSDDPNRYRANDELKPWVERDPIERLRHYLTKKGFWSDDKQSELRAEVDAAFKKAVSEAEAAPLPSLDSLFEDVFEKPPWHLEEQRRELLGGPRAPKGH